MGRRAVPRPPLTPVSGATGVSLAGIALVYPSPLRFTYLKPPDSSRTAYPGVLRVSTGPRGAGDTLNRQRRTQPGCSLSRGAWLQNGLQLCQIQFPGLSDEVLT